jgi:hypothetical protein
MQTVTLPVRRCWPLVLVVIVACFLPASAPSGDPDVGGSKAKTYVVTRTLHAENGIIIPVGTELRVEGDGSIAQTQSITLSLYASPDVLAAHCRPVTEKRDFQVLSYAVSPQ